MKKRGFGTSKWNGYGGKQDPNESIEDTAMREVKEESGIQVTAQRRRAVLDYYFVDAPEWGQRVSVFLVDTWDGEPQETEEMLPHWYPLDEIPYSEMWADDQHWLPLVLREGRTITGGFLFNREGELLEFTISEVEFLPQ